MSVDDVVVEPAAFHRLVNAKKAWTDLLNITTFFITMGMAALMFSTSLDMYVIAMDIFKQHAFALASAILLFCFMFACWFLVPQFYKLSSGRQV